MRVLTLIAACSGLIATVCAWEASDPRIALDSAFPDAKSGRPFAGELILVEHVTRRGILRLDRDGTINKYFWDLPHHFQMLPYAAIYLHGASASFEDLPLGTHLHGIFYLGPEGDFQVKPPETGYDASKMAYPDLRSIVSQYSRVLTLEDDFSYHQKRGEGWKITALGQENSNITVERVSLADGLAVKDAKDGIKSTQVLHLDRGTRIWKGREIAALEDLAVGQVVQLNLTWATLYASMKEEGLCRDIWIDPASREAAINQQRQIYIAQQKRLGFPGIILKTESLPGQGSSGYITVALPAGIEAELMDALKPKTGLDLWPVEPSLRNWGSYGSGGIEEVTRIENPPAGHSGVQIRLRFYEMLEGFRAGRTVRMMVRVPNVKGRPSEDYPRELSLYPNDTRIFHVGPTPVAGREKEPEAPKQ
ncbi:hypothetical protein [Prosthecobacter sp.]|uniref:hypothetical protein n=1 Tax=Prosthecobacter sp. TaxID=1965333 RepID=UPI00378371A2